MIDTDHQTRAAWFDAHWRDYHFEIDGVISGSVTLRVASDADIGINVLNMDECVWLSQDDARRLGQELLRLADEV